MSQDGLIESLGSSGDSHSILRGAEDERRADLATRISRRFEIKNVQEDVFDLINKKAYIGGILLAGLVLFWWVLITEGNDNISLAPSFLFALNFSNVAVTVGIFGLLSSAFKSLSREKGQLLPSLASGAMIIVCVFFIFEPLVYGFFTDTLTSSTGIWRTSRLVILFGGVTFCSTYLVEAYLLFWLKTFCEAEGINIIDNGEPVAVNDVVAVE
tara:strand:+ start:5687 stop:6325 length:639 start_codon:yes stop_codon:yes gene_type:complete